MMTCDVPEVFVSIKVILATSNTRRISSDVAFIFPLYLLHRFYSVIVEMSTTTVFTNRMFQTGPKGGIPGWEKEPPMPNKGSAERSPEKGPNPNGPRNTSPIVKGALFGNSNSPAPRNSPTPKTPNNRTPARKRPRNNKTTYAPLKRITKKRRFAPPKTPRSTRRRR